MPTSVGSQQKQENSRKTTSASLTTDFDYEDHNKLWKIPKEVGIPDHGAEAGGGDCVWKGAAQVRHRGSGTGATPRPRSGAAAERSYPMSKAMSAAYRRYPTSKVMSSGCALLE